MSWGIDILDIPLWIAKVLLFIHCSNQIRKMINQSKVSGPKWNHDYLSYSDMLIQYRWNRGRRPLISLDHARIRRLSSFPSLPGCSIGIHRYSFPPPRKVHSESQEQSLFFFSYRYGNAMQEVGNQVVSDDEKSFFYVMSNLWKPDILRSVMLEDDCWYLMVGCLRSV